MKLIRVGAAVLNQTPLDWDGNRQRIAGAIEAARAGRRQPPLPAGAVHHRLRLRRRLSRPRHAADRPGSAAANCWPETRGMIVSLGLPLLYHGSLFNTACLVADGKLLGFVGKQNLAGEGIHYEPRWFKPWPKDVQVEVPLRRAVLSAGRPGVRLRRRADRL